MKQLRVNGYEVGAIMDIPTPFYSGNYIGTISDKETSHTYTINLVTLPTENKSCPEVYCHQTSKAFLLSWEDIITLAIAAGISDKEEPKQ